MKTDNKIMAYFGHHKCASMWICSMIAPVASLLGRKYENYYHTRLFDYDLKEALKEDNVGFFSYTNADYDYVKEVKDDIVGFHVVRDPRDICVSAYFSHLNSHPTEHWPELVDHREKLKELSKDEGLLLEMEFRREEFDELFKWDYSLDNVLEIRMEDLTSRPYEGMLEIFKFLGALYEEEGDIVVKSLMIRRSLLLLKGQSANGKNKHFKIAPAELLGIVYGNRFERKAGKRKKGNEDTKHHYRKGVAGDWVNHFKKEHIEFFKANYNDLLLKLGYEEDEDWDSNYEIGHKEG